MNDFKTKFIDFTLDHGILRFGSFVLKSGRQSPYFFNTGLCNDGKLIHQLSSYYCSLIINEKLDFDFIFSRISFFNCSDTISSASIDNTQSPVERSKARCF